MRKNTLAAVVAIALIASLSMSVCAATKPAAKASKPAAKPAKYDQKAELEKFWKAPDSAVVGMAGSTKITKGELLKTLWFWQAPNVLGDLLNQKIIENAAKSAGVKVTQADIDAKNKDSIAKMGLPSVDQLLSQYRVTWQRFMDGTKVNLLAEKTVQRDLKVTDAELAQYIKARHILIRFPQTETDKAKQEEIALKRAEEVVGKLKAGEDFAKLADEYSEDPGNMTNGTKQGGSLPWFTRGRMVQDFENKAFEMKAGELSEPVKTAYGYHVIKVEKLGKDATAAEKIEIKKMIVEQKLPMEMASWWRAQQVKAKTDNKLMPPPAKEPATIMAPPPAPRPSIKPAVKPAAPATEAKPAEPAASEKPEGTPPPPPPPAQ